MQSSIIYANDFIESKGEKKITQQNEIDLVRWRLGISWVISKNFALQFRLLNILRQYFFVGVKYWWLIFYFWNLFAFLNVRELHFPTNKLTNNNHLQFHLTIVFQSSHHFLIEKLLYTHKHIQMRVGLRTTRSRDYKCQTASLSYYCLFIFLLRVSRYKFYIHFQI